MEDFPAGPASAELRRQQLSVVIPVYNGERDLECCLRRLRQTSGLDYELIVVDDGSTDASSRVAEFFGARVIRHDAPRGPAAARNTGASHATAPIVFFLDADVAVHPETLPRALARFDADPTLSALFGSYDDAPSSPGVVSQYRNLLHHFVHQRGQFAEDLRPVKTFWTGCGAIRREVFQAHGGFDPKLYQRPAIEDIELGYRVTRAGGKIVLARDVQATHLKRWTLSSVVRTDIFQRGVPWLLLMKRSHVNEQDLNVDLSGRLSVASTGLFIVAAFAACFVPAIGLLALAALVNVILLNHTFYDFLARRKGRAFAAASLPLHLIYFVCCGLSVAFALVLWHTKLAEAEAKAAVQAGLRRDDAETPPPQRKSRSVATKSRRSAKWPK